MMIHRTCASVVAVTLTLAVWSSVDTRSAQLAGPLDFARDVQPILAERCVGCHGAAQQQAGYRLDRRTDAFRGLLRPNIIAGSSEASPLFHRVRDARRGLRMPPAGPLAPNEIETLKQWIDQGAPWPDAIANESPCRRRNRRPSA
jgi:hypothetical protein